MPRQGRIPPAPSGSLNQPIGGAARHIEGRAILYADKMTESMQRAIDETNRRREKQELFNDENGITPMSIIRPLEMGLAGILKADYADLTDETEGMPDFTTQQELDAYIANLESDMREAAKKFEFEKAVKLRDSIKDLRTKEFFCLASLCDAHRPNGLLALWIQTTISPNRRFPLHPDLIFRCNSDLPHTSSLTIRFAAANFGLD